MDPLSGTRADDAAVTAAAAAATARYRANLERFNATPKQAPPPTPDAPAARLIRLCLLAHEESHATALDEIRRGRKTSHWIWWEWPAVAPVRSLGPAPRASAARRRVARRRLAAVAMRAVEHLAGPRRPSRSGTDGDRSCTLPSSRAAGAWRARCARSNCRRTPEFCARSRPSASASGAPSEAHRSCSRADDILSGPV